MTKLEQVARALLKAHYERGRGIPPTWEHLDRFQQEMWLWSAKAAIEAMREPTEAMIEASNREWDGRMAHRSSGAWQAMIDAALKE